MSTPKKSPLTYALKHMGYRPMDRDMNLWAKPVGYSLLMFNLTELRWSNVCRQEGTGTMASLGEKVFTITATKDLSGDLTSFLGRVERWSFQQLTGNSPASAVPFDF